MKTWPSRDSILEMCVACGERNGLEEKAKCLGKTGILGLRDDALMKGWMNVNYLGRRSKQ